ncbi:MAG: glycosyltransferase, partial [Pseudomonadota bacterium]
MEKSDLIVSVIIPAHNEAKTLSAAIESALFQNTNFKIEIVVVDDGSNDATNSIAANYAEKFENVSL